MIFVVLSIWVKGYLNGPSMDRGGAARIGGGGVGHVGVESKGGKQAAGAWGGLRPCQRGLHEGEKKMCNICAKFTNPGS
jgi:hypothetical protein